MRKLILLASLAVATISCEKEETIQTLSINGYDLEGAWARDSARTINYWDLVSNYDTTSYDSYPDNYHLYEFTDIDLLHTWYEGGQLSGGSNVPTAISVEGNVITQEGLMAVPLFIEVTSISATHMVLLYHDDNNAHFTSKYYVYLRKL